ncbi:MAG: GAF domain-containing protein [Anaerolineales bacterium]|nr:GAF domain-containing protein [Anaerolineales bacterium]
MRVLTKLLLPTLLIFAILLVGLIAHFTQSFSVSMQEEETRELDRLRQGLESQIASLEDLTLALATGTANNPDIQAALAAGDREQLLLLTQESYRKLSSLYNIIQFQFHVPPATSFLRVEQPDKFGDNLLATRLPVYIVNAQNRDVTGVELTAEGLTVRGIAPINPGGGLSSGTLLGSVEYAVRLDRTLLSRLKIQYGAEWHILLSQRAMRLAGYTPVGAVPASVSEALPADLYLLTSTMSEPILAKAEEGAESPYEVALRGDVVASSRQIGNLGGIGSSSYAILSVPLRDYTGTIVAIVDVVTDRTLVVQQLTGRITTALVVGGLGMLLGSLALIGFTRLVVRPVQQLTEVASAIAAGDLQRQVPQRRRTARVKKPRQQPAWLQRLTAGKLFSRFKPTPKEPGPTPQAARRGDEIEQLASSFSTMTIQLRELVGNLEQRVTERTQLLERRSNQLQAAAEVGRDITSIGSTDLDELFREAVGLIRERFNFYHAGLFLLDEAGEYAVLRAAASPAAQQMLEQGWRLRASPDRRSGILSQGLVGRVINTGQARIASDVEADSEYFRNPLLPETRSELALPLRALTAPIADELSSGSQPGGRPERRSMVIGVLDVQSREPVAFHEDDVIVLQIIADQLAIAISNARLMDASRRSVQELELAYQQYTRESWDSYTRERSIMSRRLAPTAAAALGYRYYQGRLQPLSSPDVATLTPEAVLAIRQGKVVTQDAAHTSDMGETATAPHDNARLAAPIILRNQVIGVLNLQLDTADVPQDLAILAEEAASRLALVLESARLLQEAQRLAQREQLVGQISTQVRSSLDLDAVLQAAVREIGRSLSLGEIPEASAGQKEPPSVEIRLGIVTE